MWFGFPKGSDIEIVPGEGFLLYYCAVEKKKITGQDINQVWWYSPVIPALRKLKQDDCHKFKPSLGSIVKPCLKIKTKQNKKTRGGGHSVQRP